HSFTDGSRPCGSTRRVTPAACSCRSLAALEPSHHGGIHSQPRPAWGAITMASRVGTSAPPRVLYLVTSSISLTLLRGQIGFLRQRGFDVHVACSPGAEVA